MADDFSNLNLQPGDIRPGDLITSQLMNWLLKRITDLEATVGAVVGGPIIVPNLFGRTVGDAQAILTQPGFQMVLGTVLDTFGVTILPTAQDFATRIVLGQSPPPGTRVFAHTGVALVVAATPGGPTPGPVKPSITDFNPAVQNAGEFVQILGANFAALNTANTVKFGTITAAPPTPDSHLSMLVVRIPTTIPGLPLVGSTVTIPVSVTVTSAGVVSDARTLTVGAPLPTPAPNITSISPPPSPGQMVGQQLTITGTAFVAVGQTTQVKFDNVTVTIQAGTNLSATQIIVVVPAGINGLGAPGASRTVPISVLVGNRGSNAINYILNS